jgi:hypothetical protein
MIESWWKRDKRDKVQWKILIVMIRSFIQLWRVSLCVPCPLTCLSGISELEIKKFFGFKLVYEFLDWVSGYLRLYMFLSRCLWCFLNILCQIRLKIIFFGKTKPKTWFSIDHKVAGNWVNKQRVVHFKY